MNDSPENAHGPEKIEQEASVWLLRHDRGLTATEQDEFSQWLAENRLHRECFAAQQRDWQRLDLLAGRRPEKGTRPDRDLLAPRRRRGGWLLPTTVAAAAAVGFMLLLFWPRAERRIALPQTTATVPAIGKQVFDDGSSAELNRGAELVDHYSVNERRVRLERGEAYFSVAKDPDRPFIVSAHGVEIRAVGTAFSVRVDSADVEVLVKEGSVNVGRPAANRQPTVIAPIDPTAVSANQAVRVSLSPSSVPLAVSMLTDEEVERRLAWQPKTLHFHGTSLVEIAEEFNRRNAPIRLVVADSSLRELQLSAVLRSDHVEGFIRFLETAFGVRAERAGETIFLHRTSLAIEPE